MEYILYLILFWVLTPVILTLIGLPFKKYLGTREFTNGTRIKHYDLPDWLKWMQNTKDGLTGDKRGSYWCTERYKPSIISKSLWKSPAFKMFWWSGVRNPWNYLKRNVIGIDIRKYTFHKLCGDNYVRDDLDNQGFQILYAKPKLGGLPRPMLYWVKELNKGKGICFQFGWKIKLSHNTPDENEFDNWKGLTIEPNPYKDLS